MRALKLLCVLALGVVLLVATAQASSFSNGSFEDATVNPGGSFVNLPGGNTQINAWIVTGDSIDYIGGYWQPAAGSRSLDLDGNGQGGIQQTFDTVVTRNTL